MLEKALTGSRGYWILVMVLALTVALGGYAYSVQAREGLAITGLSRDVAWGLYIAQFTFMVGIAASAVMVVLPYYLHNFKAFGKVVILGEFIAVASVIMCMLFIMVDLGQPVRGTNIMLHPTPNSLMFWDMISLFGYLGLNALIAYITFGAERKQVPPPKWIKPIIILSIPWAVSIHTVTAFLYCGLEARTFWMTAILAPRFLASAFASGPSLLIILCLILKKYTSFKVESVVTQKLGQIVTYALAVSVFFFFVELFTGVYSDMPHHKQHFEYLFFGLGDKTAMVPWSWASLILSLVALLLLVIPKVRAKESNLGVLAGVVILALWIEKGMSLIVAGFVPSPLEKVNEYTPSGLEIMVVLGVYALGFLIVTILYKIAVSVREELQS